MTTAFELFLSDEVQSLIDHFAAVLDLRVTFFSVDGRELRRGQHMRNSDYCAMVQQELGTLKECLSMDTAKRTEAVAKRGHHRLPLPRGPARSDRSRVHP